MLIIKKTSNTLIIVLSISFVMLSLSACARELSDTKETPIKTEVQGMEKPVEELMADMQDLTPKELSFTNDELIKKALLVHYNKQFGNTDAKYKTTGYKMYVVEDASPKEKKAYGFANYMEYNLENGKPVNTAGSGPTGIAITFSTDGKASNVDYEILTDDDYNSDKFKEVFPKDVQEKILKREQSDIDEVIKMQEDMLNELMK